MLCSLDVKEETSVLVLNSTGLELGAAALRYGQEEQLGLIPTQQAELERISFTLQKPLPANSKAQLQIAYSGKITDQMRGYYRSSWMDGSTSRNYALTQFEVRFPIHPKSSSSPSFHTSGNLCPSCSSLLRRTPPQSNIYHHYDIPGRYSQPEQHACCIRDSICAVIEWKTWRPSC